MYNSHPSPPSSLPPSLPLSRPPSLPSPPLPSTTLHYAPLPSLPSPSPPLPSPPSLPSPLLPSLPPIPSPPLPSLPPSLPLVTQRIHCPFQPKQSPSIAQYPVVGPLKALYIFPPQLRNDKYIDNQNDILCNIIVRNCIVCASNHCAIMSSYSSPLSLNVIKPISLSTTVGIHSVFFIIFYTNVFTVLVFTTFTTVGQLILSFCPSIVVSISPYCSGLHYHLNSLHTSYSRRVAHRSHLKHNLH